MGSVATEWILGKVNMELTHGIPRTINSFGKDLVVIPTYHPSAGLHSPEQMLLFQCDMKLAGDVIRGNLLPHPPIDSFQGRENYQEITDDSSSLELLTQLFPPTTGKRYPLETGRTSRTNHISSTGRLIAIDTEWARGKPFCLSFSVAPGEAFVVRSGQTHVLQALNRVVSCPDTTTIIQNALYDLPVLAQMGVFPAKVADTMVMAYLLQNEPQGLKALAFRHCGMQMRDYTEMVGEATYRFALEYVETVASLEWPDPAPVMEWVDGAPKIRQPQNIGKKAKKILKDVKEKGANPAERWEAVADGKGIVERLLGLLQEGELCDISWEKAMFYSARDADATIRIYPLLWDRIVALELEDTFWRDMHVMPMVTDMMANGMPVDVKEFGKMSMYFQKQMDLIQRKMQINIGHLLNNKAINPASYPQMSSLIYDKLKLHEEGGRHRSKKGAGQKSTADDILKRYIHLHSVVQDIIDWRGYQKLKTSYADTIPRKAVDGRIHTTIRLTRTVTGRLSSSNPNLMAQPTRSEEGRKIRDCYVAPPGFVLMSGDYSQVEMRVAANDARDERMMRIFWGGEDIHSITASEMFGVPIPKLDEMKHRYPAKRVGFGILNLITAEGLQRELSSGGAQGWSVADCKKMIKSWFDIYSGIAAYMKSNGEYAKRYGFIRDMWGRIRYIPGIRSTNKWIRMDAERQAGNAPIQMGAQGIIKDAMGRLVPIYQEISRIAPVKPLIQIHDDIVWEVAEEVVTLAK
jgi:DNA polymerase I-like protein with 3'-5' exonuclease and polymerase domains